MTARAQIGEIESMLKARKLDGTMAHLAPWGMPRAGGAEDLAATGLAAVDDVLGGGLRRGHLSEIVGPRSSGRTSVMTRALGAAVSRGELVALVDVCDRFDPASARAMGLDLSRLLWIRDTGDAPRGIKAMNLVLQAGGFGLVILDLADVPDAAVRGLPFTTWFRLSRVIEGSETVAVIVASHHVARSAGGATVSMEGVQQSGVWAGEPSHRARLLTGIDVRPRVVRA